MEEKINILYESLEKLENNKLLSSQEKSILKIIQNDKHLNQDIKDFYSAEIICNHLFDLEEIETKMHELLSLKQNLFKDLESKVESCYDTIKEKITCVNLKKINKYGLYQYIFSSTDFSFKNKLWEYKNKDCLTYVAEEANGLLVSIRFNQIDNFICMLDIENIDYSLEDIYDYIRFLNKSDNKLVDYKKYSLPFKPYAFQIEDAETLVKMKRALIGGEMGIGKTFISCLIGESIKGKKLVICPESLRLNWQKEILQVDPTLDVQILLSNEEYHEGKDWTIIGYHTASKFADKLLFDCVFVDECHYIKAVNNWGKPTSKRAKAVINISNRATYCYLLSGTPVPSRNKDLFNILKILKCNNFDFNSPWAFKNYADKFCDPKQVFGHTNYDGSSNNEELHEILSSIMIRRLKKDVLPGLKKQRQFIPLKPKFKKDYKDIENRLRNLEPPDTYMGLAMTGRSILSQYKIDTAIDLAENLLDAEESVILVTNFIETADKLKAKFGKQACEIRGGMSDKEKQKAVEEFQSKKKKVCILNLMAGGVGLTLTASCNMIILDYDWTPSNMVQVEDRICRPGQDECCNIYYLYCENSIFDYTFIKMISKKSNIISETVDNEETDYDLVRTRREQSTYLDLLKAQLVD